jgi:RNA polymerase sigma-70 factor (ECF subfamily)
MRLDAAFRRYSPELYRYVLRRLRRPADAADLTQEIFERLLRSEGVAKALNPQAYLFGIAANVVADARMAEGRSPVTYDSESSRQLAEALPNAFPDLAERVELEQELRTALAQLPEMQRTALLLTKWEGLSIQEAAARMNLAAGSVAVYVCEARARLKILLKGR